MRLAELSPAEQSYLSSSLPQLDDWTPVLTQRVSRLLGARMKQSVEIAPVATRRALPRVPRETPDIVADSALNALWVSARLGGRVRSCTPCTALARNLHHSLEHLLAETWLSAPHELIPASLQWRIATDETDATLTIHFPDTLARMDRWARRTIAA